jgi:hypothetical protein
MRTIKKQRWRNKPMVSEIVKICVDMIAMVLVVAGLAVIAKGLVITVTERTRLNIICFGLSVIALGVIIFIK